MRKARLPSFSGLKPASLAASQAKRANRATDTEAEVLLRKTLHRMGLRFRKHVKNLPGRPDIVFVSARVVVFCDGDFWHGRNWRSLQQKLAKGTNSTYWMEKLRANMLRDRRTNRRLKQLAWRVVRVWETKVLADPAAVAEHILPIVRSRSGTCGTIPHGGRRGGRHEVH
jgi:DNA mismatch endonuclease (patch repair protein)